MHLKPAFLPTSATIIPHVVVLTYQFVINLSTFFKSHFLLCSLMQSG